MELSREQVEKVADLAQIGLTDEEKTRLAADLSSVIGYIDELAAVDVAAVSEKQAANSQITGTVNATRPDEVKDCEIARNVFLGAAPAKEGAYIKVKKVLSK